MLGRERELQQQTAQAERWQSQAQELHELQREATNSATRLREKIASQEDEVSPEGRLIVVAVVGSDWSCSRQIIRLRREVTHAKYEAATGRTSAPPPEQHIRDATRATVSGKVGVDVARVGSDVTADAPSPRIVWLCIGQRC